MPNLLVKQQSKYNVGKLDEKFLNNPRKFFAFTLAEVLITLVIIGIIAALTIPTLVNNYQKKTYVTQIKKFYATSNQALNLMIKDYGCAGDLACTGLLQPPITANSVDDFNDAYVKYFKTVKICKYSSGCWPSLTNYNYDGSGSNSTGFNNDGHGNAYYNFITADGMSVALRSQPLDGYNASSGITGNMKQYYGYILVDVNGVKGPNMAGRDTFEFYITNGKGALIYPAGGLDTLSQWETPSGQMQYCYPENPMGFECAARVMEEGWEMNY